MIEQTTKYEMFKFRDDNRVRIDKRRVKELAESIKKRNLLFLHPIDVNEKFEVMNGQTRLLAAKELGVPIFYRKTAGLTALDMLQMNMQYAWSVEDICNFYCKNGYSEYIKLKNFADRYNVPVRFAFGMCCNDPNPRTLRKSFREGEFEYMHEDREKVVNLILDSILMIEEWKGVCTHLKSLKCFRALTKIFEKEEFDRERWFKNLKLLRSDIMQCVSSKHYFDMFERIYNYNRKKGRIHG